MKSSFVKRLLLLAIFLFIGLPFNLVAQTTGTIINPDEFKFDLFNSIFISKINEQRTKLNKDYLYKHEILEKAATDQSEYISKIKKTVLEGSSSSKRTTGDRIKYYGGATSGQEIVQSCAIGKDIKTFYTYEFVIDELMVKVLKSKKYSDIICNPKAFYVGIGSSMDANGKKIYISIVVGGLEAVNEGKKLRKLLNLKYTTKEYGIERGNAKECRNCERFDDYITLQKGISIQGGKVLFEYPNVRKLRKLFATPEDGIAIDIVQKSQYPCDTFNIFDADKQNRGILLKPAFSSKIWKANTEPERYNRYSGYIADVPKNVLKNLGDQYEINVNIIQKGKFCRRITRTFTEANVTDKLKGISIFPDTANNCADCKIEDDYVLDSTSKILSFKIPFDKNKSEYKPRDLEPILNTLNEPKYTINEINIIAYTSLEGDSTKNALLQIKRAKTIIEALEKINKNDIVNNIETFDAYDMFKQQVMATEKYMYSLIPKRQLIDTLNKSKKMREEFADILEAERVTMINMKVTYATQGDDELDFIIHSMKKAVEHNQAQRAKRLQHFAMDEALKGKYSPTKLIGINYPLKKEYVSLILNNLFLESRFLKDDSITLEMQLKLQQLENLDPDNIYIKYNQLVSFVNFGYFKDELKVEEVTNRIEGLKKTKLPRNLVEALNLELQFKIIDTYDTMETAAAKRMSTFAMDRIKNLFAIGNNGKKWENALKLAEVFMRHNDYKYATQLLLPFIRENDIDEKLIFTFISCAARFQENWFSPDFRFALSKARELNSKRYCSLFADPYLSIQVLENPLIKSEFCNNCR